MSVVLNGFTAVVDDLLSNRENLPVFNLDTFLEAFNFSTSVLVVIRHPGALTVMALS